MNNEPWALSGEGERLIRLVRGQAGGRTTETVSPVLTVRQVCQRLHKSRRQLYRYLRDGRLKACARVLGQWLFAQADVDDCAHPRLPSLLRPWFWDVPLASLAPDRHEAFILGRVLEFGDQQAVRWLLRTYPRPRIRAFLKGRGADVLSRRTWHFWALFFGRRSRARPTPSWRAQGHQWGGWSAAAP